jgi:hypothetical protein
MSSLNPEDKKRLQELDRIVRGIRGPYVKNGPDGIVIGPPEPRRIIPRGGTVASTLRLVFVDQVGGSAGTNTTACTFTYDVYGDAGLGDLIASAKSVLFGRYIKAAYIAANYGLYDTASGILICVDESATQTNCT